MGKGAIIAGQIAEMAIPSLLLFAIVFGVAKSNLKLKTGAARILGLWFLTLVISGIINVLLYSLTSNGPGGSIFFLAIPTAVAFVVVVFIAPRQVQNVPDEKNS